MTDTEDFSKTKPMELKHFNDCIAWWNDRKEISDGEFFKAQKFTADYLLNEQGCNIDLCGYPHKEEEVLAPADLIQKYEEERASLNAEIDRTIFALNSSLNGDDVAIYTQSMIGACGKMDDIHKRFPVDMQKSILQTAIQGKLVEQRPEEGTGEELYRQIQAEKQMLTLSSFVNTYACIFRDDCPYPDDDVHHMYWYSDEEGEEIHHSSDDERHFESVTIGEGHSTYCPGKYHLYYLHCYEYGRDIFYIDTRVEHVDSDEDGKCDNCGYIFG